MTWPLLLLQNEAPGADNIYGNILRARRSLETDRFIGRWGIPDPGEKKDVWSMFIMFYPLLSIDFLEDENFKKK